MSEQTSELDTRNEVMRWVMRLIDYGKPTTIDPELDGLSIGVVADRIIALPTDYEQVWCVAYDDPTPYMDGVKAIRMGQYPTAEQAEAALRVVESRSANAPKRNLRIETRLVTPWEPAEGETDGAAR